MKNHFSRYATAYLIGFFFMAVTVGNAFLGEFSNLTPDQVKNMTPFQWCLSWVHVLVAASTTILAFLNKQVANVDLVQRPAPPPVTVTTVVTPPA
jgi:hypothetical protein